MWAAPTRPARTATLAGANFPSALVECERLQARGFRTTVGCWNGADHDSGDLALEFLSTAEALAGAELECRLSIKPLALAFRRDLLRDVVRRAATLRLPMQFDSPAAEVADVTFSAMNDSLCANADLGCTLPGRWRRSLTDAVWAIAQGFSIRVVKGQWADPDDPRRDAREGFLAVINHIAARARFVSVATHDAPLAREALSRLQASRTPCELELLVGQPVKAVLQIAARLGVPVRGYVAYGDGALLYRAA
jgi:proline dehydrogenase